MSLLKRLLLRVALLAVTLAVVLGGLEVVLRLFWDGFYVKVSGDYAQNDPVRGWANRPDVSRSYGEPEFNTIVTHNRFGYRSPAIEHERTPGRPRVLVLGDSFAYGVGVQDDQTFSAELQRLDPELEVINTGVNGYGTGQELLLLRDEGLAFRPDVVLVSFFWNDIGNSYTNQNVHFALEGGQLRYPPPPPPGADVAAKKATARKDARPDSRAWLRYSYAYRFLSDRLKMLQYTGKLLLGIPVRNSDLVTDAEREAAWQLELTLLREIDRVSRENGARMVLLVIPEQVQVEPDKRALGIEPVDYAVQERLHAFAKEAGIPVVDPLPALSEAYAKSHEPLYYLRDRHLRPAGQALLAREILETLEKILP